jgi:hypothetical protein
MAASAAARLGLAQIIFSATLFACAQSNEGFAASAASPTLAAKKASADPIPIERAGLLCRECPIPLAHRGVESLYTTRAETHSERDGGVLLLPS